MRKTIGALALALAAGTSTALADQTLYDGIVGTNVTSNTTLNSTVVGAFLTLEDPSPQPWGITGIDFAIVNFTGASIPVNTNLRVTLYLWNDDDPAAAGTSPVFTGTAAVYQATIGPLTAAFLNAQYFDFQSATPGVTPALLLPVGTPWVPTGDGITTFAEDIGVALKIEKDNAGDLVFATAPNLHALLVHYNTPNTVGNDYGGWFTNANDPAFMNGNFQAGQYYAFNGTTDNHLHLRVYNVGTPPLGGVGAASPDAVSGCGSTSLLTVTVTPDTGPTPSTGIAVNADLTALGQGATNAMFDNGTNGDVTSGDNIFSLNVNVGSGPDALLNVPFTVSDAQARTASGSIAISRDLSGDTIAGAFAKGSGGATIVGHLLGGNDIDTHTILINDVNNFSASTVGGATWDTSLFLFAPNGTGLLFNDDSSTTNLQSNMAGVVVPGGNLGPGGRAYLSIAAYGHDAVNISAQEIWADTPFETTRTPDGAGAGDPVLAAYAGAGDDGGTYTITLTGAQTPCPADVSGTDNGQPDGGVDISDLLYFLAAFEAGSPAADLSGAVDGVPDCGVDISDLLFLLAHFETGC